MVEGNSCDTIMVCGWQHNGWFTVEEGAVSLIVAKRCCCDGMLFGSQVEDKVEELRELLPGERVAGVVSVAPDLLLNDVQTCLRPRMTRLVAALTTVKQFQGVLDADKVIFCVGLGTWRGCGRRLRRCCSALGVVSCLWSLERGAR